MYNLRRIACFARKLSAASSRARSVISVEPKSSLVDTKVKILVSGLEPKQNVTLRARLAGEKGDVFESYAHYVADKDGGIDVGSDSSFGGSYRGVEPMGLLWSMKLAPGQRKGIRLIKRDVTKPFEVELKCFGDHISPNEGLQQPLSSVTFERWYMEDGVKRIVLKDQGFHGTLFIPPGDGPFPGEWCKLVKQECPSVRRD